MEKSSLLITCKPPKIMTGSSSKIRPVASMSDQIRALHLVGSSASEFYFDLSVAYARTCADFEGLHRDRFTHNFAVVHTTGEWSFPTSLDTAAVAEAPRPGRTEREGPGPANP